MSSDITNVVESKVAQANVQDRTRQISAKVVQGRKCTICKGPPRLKHKLHDFSNKAYLDVNHSSFFIDKKKRILERIQLQHTA